MSKGPSDYGIFYGKHNLVRMSHTAFHNFLFYLVNHVYMQPGQVMLLLKGYSILDSDGGEWTPKIQVLLGISGVLRQK